MSAPAPPVASTAALIRASLLNLVARLISGAAALGLAAITTNLLDTRDRGIYAILATWALICQTVIAGGTPVLAADLIHGRRDERALHGASFAIAMLSCVLLLPIGLAARSLIGGVTLTALLCTVAVTVLVVYACFEMGIAQARGDVLTVSLTDIGLALFPLATAAFVAIIFERTVATFMAAWAVGALVPASVLFALAPPADSLRLRLSVAGSIVRRSVRVSVANGLSVLYSRIDLLIVAAVLSTSAAGVYSVPVALATALLLLSRSLRTATYYSIMTASTTDVAERLSATLRHSVIVVLVGGALSVPVVAVAGGVVFGDAYSEIWRPYAILVPSSVCWCVCEMLFHFVITRMERQREYILITTAMLILNGVLAVVGASAFGLLGAAASTTITYAFEAVALVVFCSRALSVSMAELVVPRRADFGTYWGVVRSQLIRPRSAGSETRS